MTTPAPQLSELAMRLLRLLKRHATERRHAITDATIAGMIDVDARKVVDLAGELLDAGHLVVAETTSPPGRWLVSRVEDLHYARHYGAVLGHRAVANWRRSRTVRRLIDQMAAAQRADTTGDGQRWLFPADEPAGERKDDWTMAEVAR